MFHYFSQTFGTFFACSSIWCFITFLEVNNCLWHSLQLQDVSSLFFLTFLKFFTCNSLEMVWSFTKVELLPHPHPLARFDNFHSLLGTFWRGVIIGAPAGLSSIIITGKPVIQSSMISTLEPSWAVSIKAVGSYGLEKLC